jgi:hypothetical protein
MVARMLALVLSSSALAGCASGGWAQNAEATQKKVLNASVAFDGAQHPALDVAEGNGAIKVVRDDTLGQARIEATIRSKDAKRLEAARLTSAFEDGVLRVRVEWPGGKEINGDAASFVITGPAFDGLTLETGNGEIEIEGQSGAAKLKSGNGSVVATAHRGEAELRTGNGEIEAKEITGRVFADSGNGSVSIVAAGGEVTARSDNGDVAIELADACAGPVTASSGMGDVALTLGRGFRGAIDGSTGMGGVRVIGSSPAARVVSRSNRAFNVEVGSGAEVGAERSRVSSGMGSVSVRLAKPNA